MQACYLGIENKREMSLGKCAGSENSMALVPPYSNKVLVASSVRLRLDQLCVRWIISSFRQTRS
jgi:hypothetical protein